MSGIRLALRQEGSSWNAYAAMTNTMQGALLLGSLNMRLAQHPEIKAAFMALMQLAMEDLIKEVTGGDVKGWKDPTFAPAHEKAGNA